MKMFILHVVTKTTETTRHRMSLVLLVLYLISLGKHMASRIFRPSYGHEQGLFKPIIVYENVKINKFEKTNFAFH